jgi:hypothetical protein
VHRRKKREEPPVFSAKVDILKTFKALAERLHSTFKRRATVRFGEYLM